MARLKNKLDVQLYTESDLDKLPDSGSNGGSNPDINYDYSFLGYTPSAVDYIRRCRTKKEAFEILDYLKKRDEISKDEYKEMIDRVKKEGLSSFGTIKDVGFYGNEVIR